MNSSKFVTGRWYVWAGGSKSSVTIMKIQSEVQHAYWDVWFFKASNYNTTDSPTCYSRYAQERSWELIDLDLPEELMLKHISLTYGVLIK